MTNSIDGIKVATGDTSNTTVGCNPKLLTKIELPNSESNARPIGDYYANTTSFTKANTSEFEKYLSFDETKGWTVLKSGNYMINSAYYFNCINNKQVIAKNCMIINQDVISLNLSSVRNTNELEEDINNTTIYLEKGTIINFYNSVTINMPNWHYVSFSIYALFK